MNMVVRAIEQDVIEILRLWQELRDKPMATQDPKSKITMPLRMRAYQADIGVWAVLMEAIRVVHLLVKALRNTADYTARNVATEAAEKLLKDFTDDEDLGA